MSDKMITLTPSVFMGGNSHGFNFSAGIVAGLYSDKLSKDIKSGNNFQGIFGLVPWAGPSYDFYDLTDGFENKKLGGVGGVNAFYLPSGMSFGVGWSNGVSVEQNLNRNRLEVGFRSYLNVGLPILS